MPRCPICGYSERVRPGERPTFWPDQGSGLIVCPECGTILGGDRQALTKDLQPR